MAGLVQPGELSTYLQEAVPLEQAAMAIRVAEGWLTGATGLSVWPEPVPADLWAWALELAALAFTNPTGLERQEAGEVADVWGAVQRRREILKEAARGYAARSAPQGSFPPPQPWPCW